MKLTTEELKKMIREAISESHGDDFDMGKHVQQKRMGRMDRGESDPRNLPAGDGDGTYVDTPGVEQGIIDDLKKQFGPGGEQMAKSIIDAVKKMKEDGLI